MGSRNVKNGVCFYTIVLKKPLPKFIQIGGKSVKTLYTVQERATLTEDILINSLKTNTQNYYEIQTLYPENTAGTTDFIKYPGKEKRK